MQVWSAAELGVSPAESKANNPTPTTATHILRSIGRPMLRTPSFRLGTPRTDPLRCRSLVRLAGQQPSHADWEPTTDHHSGRMKSFGGGVSGKVTHGGGPRARRRAALGRGVDRHSLARR